jgi:uncharacterized phage protein (TIGR02218 family)
MTYTAYETSSYLGHPIEIYEFSRGVIIWRYTTADEDKVIGAFTYKSIIAERGGLEQTQEMSRNPISISMDKDVDFLAQFKGAPPSDPINLTIKRYHESDTEVLTIWVGRIVNVKFKEREAEIRCEPIFTALKRPILRRRYQTTCPHVLYGQQCSLTSLSFANTAIITAVSGKTLTAVAIGARAAGYFAGGFTDWSNNLAIERRFITDHTGSTITLNLPYNGILVGQTITVYPGCDHLLTTCNSKFANDDNYGGQPFYPSKNPLGGSLIF